MLSFRIFCFPARAKFKPAPSNVKYRPSWLSDTDTFPPTNDSKLSYGHCCFPIIIHGLSAPGQGSSDVSPGRSTRNVDYSQQQRCQHVPFSTVVTAGTSAAAWLGRHEYRSDTVVSSIHWQRRQCQHAPVRCSRSRITSAADEQ